MTSNHLAPPRWQYRLFVASIVMLVFSGLGQMPLYKRYYISDIPGLAWTSDFFIQHVLHYVAAALFLVLVFTWAAAFWRHYARAYQLTMWGWLRVGAVCAIIASGFFRVLKNLPDWFFSPEATMIIGWSHLAAGLVFGLLALAARVAGKPAYVQAKS